MSKIYKKKVINCVYESGNLHDFTSKICEIYSIIQDIYGILAQN